MTRDQNTDVKQKPAAGRRISLRTLLLLLMVALSLVTVGGTGLVAYRLSYDSLTELQTRAFRLMNYSAANEIGNDLDEPASEILAELTHRAELGLQAQDSMVLGRDLAERLRVHPELAWISYSDAATGEFTGVWRTANGDVILNHSTPDATPVEQVATPDGKLLPHERTLTTLYDPRKTRWFQQTVDAPGIVWSDPYRFMDGKYGITASKAWRKNGTTAPTGIFTVDFFMIDLEKTMGDLCFNRGFIWAFRTDGGLLCAPKGFFREQFTTDVSRLVKTAPLPPPNTDYKHLFTLKRDGETYLIALYHVQTDSGLDCVVASMDTASAVYKQANDTVVVIAKTGLLALCLAFVLGWGFAKRISHPLRLLSSDLEKVGDLQFTTGSLKKSILRELQILIESSERMKSGLRSFLHYVPDDLVRRLLRSGRDAALGVETRRLTILFSDIENFTSYSERVPKEKLVIDLSGYFDIFTRAVRQYSGTIDKFTGDGVLAFFNAPLDVPDHEESACRSALAAVGELHGTGNAAGKLPFRTRIGLHAGDVLVGNVGTAERFAYTVLGDVVNTSSRIESLNKVYGTHILASDDVRNKTDGKFEWRYVDRVAVAGRRGTLNLHELLGIAGGDVDAGILRARDLYEQALDRYFAQDFARARDLFAGACEARAGDKTAKMMMHRCDDLIKNGPGDGWDGVFVHKHK